MGEQADRLARGEWYLDDDELPERRQGCRRLLDVFNSVPGDDDAKRSDALAALVGLAGDNVVVPRLTCSYGTNISLGDGASVNGNAFFMDDAPITVAANVRIGPGAQLMTALHPIDDHARRRQGWERALPIVIGENSWLAAAVTVGAGVTIGRNVVTGAGSVVLTDIPDHTIAAGTPARVIRSTPYEEQ